MSRPRARSRSALAVLTALALAGVGCASDDRMYHWSSHQRDLYSGPTFGNRAGPDSKQFEATVKRIIERSDTARRKAPPGLLAEYGYFLFQRGQIEDAVFYFEREAREWPESAAFMQRMIQRAQAGADS